MLYKNTKAKVRSPDVDADFFDTVAGVLQGDISIISVYNLLDYVLRTSLDLLKENGFPLEKTRSR